MYESQIMLLHFLSSLLLLLPGIASADTSKSLYTLPRITSSIVIDGIADDEAWQEIDPLPVVMYQPVYKSEMTERTVVKIVIKTICHTTDLFKVTAFNPVSDINTDIPRLIIDTDFRSDADDAGTLAMANVLADKGECELIGVIASQTGPFIVSAINAVNTYYGRGDVPIGLSPVDDVRHPDYYAPEIGDPAKFQSTQSNKTAPESTTLYRRLLNESPDSSVIITVIGGQTCIHLLLKSEADYEGDKSINLTGQELINRKVRKLVIMAGDFENSSHAEHNIRLDLNAAQTVASEWPGKIVYSGFEIGRDIFTGEAFNRTPEHPVATAYKLFPAGGIGVIASSCSFDQTAVYYAVRGIYNNSESLWQISEPGRVSFIDGLTKFTPDPNGRHRYLIKKADPNRVGEIIEELMIFPPVRAVE